VTDKRFKEQDGQNQGEMDTTSNGIAREFEARG
jgi:hypothetical protein